VFVPEEGWPSEMWHDLIVAYHGSWNRSVPTGYKIVRIPLDAEGNVEQTEEFNIPIIHDFLTGFITEDGELRGRPAGLLIDPGGVLFISDDRAGVVYRVSYDEVSQ